MTLLRQNRRAAKKQASQKPISPEAEPFPSLPIAVQMATAVPKPPTGNQWLHEIKLDGYRMVCAVRGGKARFFSRSGADWTSRLGSLAEIINRNIPGDALLDGEVVVFDRHGLSQFQMLQNAFRTGQSNQLVYVAFDLLYRDGSDLRRQPLESRKQVLCKLISQTSAESPRIRLSEHFVGTQTQLHTLVCEMHAEGLVSKRRDAPYLAGRGTTWLKCKCRASQELIIAGFTAPARSRRGFGALLLGWYDDAGRLRYAGRVGSGFNEAGIRVLHAKLKSLIQPKPAFTTIPRGIDVRGVTWVRPELVAQIEFSNWTDEGIVRQASFQGLREDKIPRDVTRDLGDVATFNAAG